MIRLHRSVKFSPSASVKMGQRFADLAVARYPSARFLMDHPESGAV
jgi:hypothetical protein